eukprot:s539_g22.t1
MVVATTILHAWAKTFRVTFNTTPIVTDVRNCLLSVERAIDLPEDVWAFGGYQILKADNGVYDAIVARNKAFSLFSNVLSSMTETQAAQGSTEIKHIPNWEVPLMPGDGREPIATEQMSSWDHDPMDMRPPQAAPHPEALPFHFKEERSKADDFAGTRIVTRYWADSRSEPKQTIFLLSVMQGPMASAPGISGWAQYLRRDSLSGQFRNGTTILITDLQFTIATTTGSHNFVMGLQDMGWGNVIVYKIQDMESNSNVEKFMDTATKVKEYVEANPQLVNLTIHVWLSLSFIMNPNPPHVVLTDANFHILVRGSIQELEEVCPRPVFVAVCPDSRFNNVEGRTDEIAKKLAAELREWGILCSTSENMWRMMYSQFGHQFKSLRKAPEGSAGKNAIWSAMEKALFRQRVFLMCASPQESSRGICREECDLVGDGESSV